ncbi:MAG TPA: hypothetical protein ENH19_01460, partial [Actinobacteria bacterium]|nr:hypothetical protein [Actinomycetes bacterium]HEX21304.1 hypothetical protein [Actinomycetota bacterium]
MVFQVPTEKYSGKIEEVTLGTGDNAVIVGGATTLAWHNFEGDIPNQPKIAMEVFDNNPQDWPEAVAKPLADVLGDPVKWAL